MKKMPLLFIGHGSPMNIILDNGYTRSLKRLGSLLPKPKAILVVSAHWLTKGSFITFAKEPNIIYDFYGFPKELYEMKYPCPGGAAYSEQLPNVMAATGIQATMEWGLDHAAWAVLKHMYPQADIPVMELSLDYTKPAQYHYELGRKLSLLREEGILIIGSGNIVHNLRRIEMETEAKPYSWAVTYDETVKVCLTERNHSALIHYETLNPDASLAVPTNEHYLPLLYVLGMQGETESLSFTYEGIQNASISMRCLYIGENAKAFSHAGE